MYKPLLIVLPLYTSCVMCGIVPREEIGMNDGVAIGSRSGSRSSATLAHEFSDLLTIRNISDSDAESWAILESLYYQL